MPKIFTSYCVLVIVLMGIANSQGYTVSSLFNQEGKAQKVANRYHK
jgi:hypothetical protein